ncbi:hypothetical protein KEM52_001997 [Ascosphaera acerosa]|nr:hypothetical protein KEM52_001997 [Ascosphaera acerosa]
MSLRIVPAPAHTTRTSNTARGAVHSKGAPSAPGIHDTLRANLTAPPTAPSTSTSSAQSETTSSHPLEARLVAWRTTQESMKMESLRRLYGIAEPVRRGMELKMVRDADAMRPAMLGGGVASVHEDILVLGGRDAEVGWEDVFTGNELREPPAFHDEVEHRLRMN